MQRQREKRRQQQRRTSLQRWQLKICSHLLVMPKRQWKRLVMLIHVSMTVLLVCSLLLLVVYLWV